MATIMIKIMANIRIEIESQLMSGMPAYLRARALLQTCRVFRLEIIVLPHPRLMPPDNPERLSHVFRPAKRDISLAKHEHNLRTRNTARLQPFWVLMRPIIKTVLATTPAADPPQHLLETRIAIHTVKPAPDKRVPRLARAHAEWGMEKTPTRGCLTVRQPSAR